METGEILLNPKQYYQLECLLRSDRYLTERLANNQLINGSRLLETILYEIADLEYDEGGNKSLKYRIYQPGRQLLKQIEQQLYPKETEKLLSLIGTEHGSIEEKRYFTIKIISSNER